MFTKRYVTTTLLSVLVLVLILTGCTAPAPAPERKPASGPSKQGFSIIFELTPAVYPVVEQQTPGGAMQPDPDLWIVNPTPCVWDSDDRRELIAAGKLRPGEEFSVSKCVIMEWDDHLVGITAHGRKQDDFKISIEFSDGSLYLEREATLVTDGRSTAAKLSAFTPHYQKYSDKLLPIDNSNGGQGLFMVVTWKIVNTGSRTADLSLRAMIGLTASYNHDDFCSYPLGDFSHYIREGSDPRIQWCP